MHENDKAGKMALTHDKTENRKQATLIKQTNSDPSRQVTGSHLS
jgi:hypothetical protein